MDANNNEQLKELIQHKKRYAAQLIKSAKLNGDIKNIHTFCKIVGISTSIYRDIMAGHEVYNVETAIKIIDSIEKINSGEIKLPRKKRESDEPDFADMLKLVAHAGQRHE